MPKAKATKAVAKQKTLTYDVAEQLRTPEEMAAYLDAWLDGSAGGCGRYRSRAGGYRSGTRHVAGGARCRT